MTRAPKLVGSVWFNSKPLIPDDLKNKVVLYDFWTYSCINCQRTLPYLRDWWNKYKDKGLVIIGIHAPEFDFEKNPENVEKAIKDLNIGWPVLMDNDHKNWNNFANNYWPAKYIADKSGNILYTHFGEGGYAETELTIQQLLIDMGEDKLPEVNDKEHKHDRVCFIATPETYCGYGKGKIANHGGYIRDEDADYDALKELEEDSIALQGKFLAKSEYVETREEEAALLLKFRATEVNLVLHPVGGSAVAEVLFQGERVRREIRGKDITDESGVRIKEATLYNLIKSEKPLEGVLKIRARDGNFRAYAFTFSGCTG